MKALDWQLQVEIVKFVDKWPQPVVVGLPCLGRRDSSRRPVEQPHSELGFQARNQL
jgi:hypothetical protein